MLRCLNSWKEYTTESLRLKHVCRKVTARWRKAGLVATMRKWEAYVNQRQQDKWIVETWCHSIKRRQISAGWRAWLLFVQQSEVDALKTQVVRMQKEKQDTMCKRVLIRMLFFKVSSAWKAWREHVRLSLIHI